MPLRAVGANYILGIIPIVSGIIILRVSGINGGTLLCRSGFRFDSLTTSTLPIHQRGLPRDSAIHGYTY